MLVVILAVSASLSEPNRRNLSLEPLGPCLGGRGMDAVFLTHLADFGPAAIAVMVLLAYVCGDKVETLHASFNLSMALLLFATVSLRLFCFSKRDESDQRYPKQGDFFFLVAMESLAGMFFTAFFALVLIYRPGPGTPAEMLYEPLLELWHRPTFRHMFVQVVSPEKKRK